jgi:hypothetical protein
MSNMSGIQQQFLGSYCFRRRSDDDDDDGDPRSTSSAAKALVL